MNTANTTNTANTIVLDLTDFERGAVHAAAGVAGVWVAERTRLNIGGTKAEARDALTRIELTANGREAIALTPYEAAVLTLALAEQHKRATKMGIAGFTQTVERVQAKLNEAAEHATTTKPTGVDLGEIPDFVAADHHEVETLPLHAAEGTDDE